MAKGTAWTQLTKEMKFTATELDAVPDDEEWTQDELADLDDLRHAALRLAEMAEATIDTLQGHTGRPSA